MTRPKKPKKREQARLIKAHPRTEEARDEGPRLIPLEEPKKMQMDNYSRKYLELADIALKPPKK